MSAQPTRKRHTEADSASARGTLGRSPVGEAPRQCRTGDVRFTSLTRLETFAKTCETNAEPELKKELNSPDRERGPR